MEDAWDVVLLVRPRHGGTSRSQKKITIHSDKIIKARGCVESIFLFAKPVDTAPAGTARNRTGIKEEAVMNAYWPFTGPLYHGLYHPVDDRTSFYHLRGFGSRI